MVLTNWVGGTIHPQEIRDYSQKFQNGFTVTSKLALTMRVNDCSLGERLMAMQAMRKHFRPVAPPQPVEFLLHEIDGLRAEQSLVEQFLVDSGQFAIIHARGPQIPRLLEENRVTRECGVPGCPYAV